MEVAGIAVDESRFREQTLKDAAQAIRNTIVGRLHDDGLNHHDVQFRVKKPESAAEKLMRRGPDGELKYPGGLAKLDDLIGVRVILYVESDIEAVAIALSSQFICHDDEDKTAMMRKNGGIGYAGRHLTLEVPTNHPPTNCKTTPDTASRFKSAPFFSTPGPNLNMTSGSRDPAATMPRSAVHSPWPQR